jgi:hypothetical protein
MSESKGKERRKRREMGIRCELMEVVMKEMQ